MPVKSSVYRLHDPLTRSNWGGRSTSLALGRIIEGSAGRRIESAIGAPYILQQLTEHDQRTPGRTVFDLVDDIATEIASPPSGASALLIELHDMLEGADELVVNGEGDLILRERLTLVRTLATMRAAKKLGKPVHLLNSILSHGPTPPDHEQLIIDQVGATIELCDSVVYRDPHSLALHRELFPRLDATWSPDALFSWAAYARTDLARRDAFSPETEGLPISVQRLLVERRPYAVVSGTSRYRINHARFRNTMIAFADQLASRGVETVFASTDEPDRKLAETLDGTGIVCVDPKVPLSAASRLLWNATALVSGRYHPSILASLGGTPFVLMASNSHKTRSLYEVVPFGGEVVEEPFFSGGKKQGGHLAEVVLGYANSAVRRRVSRSARSNGRRVVADFTRAITGTATRS
ncbi:polysaccharide pyruvyl transferase family protein [Promicromonospora panici]|uniref:polysaccharide pyruvyl transferase family protein n=1 Tax=Promicromonospora panici TaxID=2219658 RepID=UPI0013E9CDD9|nr:polysaccharide pyruvyl transferase family protein [Promicromonospora panici]